MTRFLGMGFITGIVMFVVGGVFHLLIPVCFPFIETAYTNTSLFRPWTGWTQYYMMAHPFWFGFVFVLVFVLLRDAGRQSGLLQGKFGGIGYGLGVFVVGSLPVFLLAFASLQVPFNIILAWSIQNCTQYVVAGGCLEWLDALYRR